MPLQRYGQGRGGYQSNFRYDNNQPAAFQYQSFYDPIPVDSLIASSQRSAQEYDVGYAGALAAQDEMAQSLVGMQDIASKNEILNESIGDMNTTVEEKFGGDWGRASKDIAAQVTQVRSNPFWNTAKEADKRRDEARELKIKYGANAFIFNDPTTKGVMGDDGKLRGAEEFTPDILEKGDWGKSARELMAGLNPDANPWGLTRDEIDTFINYGQIEEVTREKIEGFASDPAIQEALLAKHSEIRRGVNEFGDQQKEQFGLTGKTANDVAYEQLLGAAASAQYRQVDMKTVQDQDLIKSRATTRTANPPVTPTTNPSKIVGNVWEGQQKPRDVHFSSAETTKGQIATVEERLARGENPSMASMMPIFNHYGIGMAGLDAGVLAAKGIEGIRKVIRNSADGNPMTNPLWLIANTSKSVKEFAARAAEQKDKDFLTETIKMYPELGDYTPEVAMQLANSANKKLGQKSNTMYNYGIDWQEAETQNFVYDSKTKTPGRIFGQELYMDGRLISGERKEELFFKELDMKPGTEEADEALQKARVADMAYTGNTPGEYIINVKDKKGVNHTVEMSPNKEVQELATPSWAIAEYIRTGGQSNRLQDYEVSNTAPQQDEEGNLIVPIRGAVEIEGKPYMVFYQVSSEIVPKEKGSSDGIHQPDIKQFVVREDGTRFVINEGMELKDVIDFDQSQVEEYYTTMRNKRQTKQ